MAIATYNWKLPVITGYLQLEIATFDFSLQLITRNCHLWLVSATYNLKLPPITGNREFTIGQRERERQSKNARSRSRSNSRFKSLWCNNWNTKDEMALIISKPKQTWQKQVLIKLCCWVRIAQKQPLTPNFFHSMLSIRVQICIYHIGNMTSFH